jgi:DNA-binding transcriptional ArsR family regulator
MSNQSADAVFEALGEPVRRRILELLHDGPTPVGQLAERLPVGRPAVSKHLRVLSNAGLIEHHSVGTRNLYALAPDGMAAAQQWLADLGYRPGRLRRRGQPSQRAPGTHPSAPATHPSAPATRRPASGTR